MSSKTRYYSLKEVAEVVGVHSATIIRWIDQRKVRLKKKKNASGHYVFTEDDLRALTQYHTAIHTVE